MKFIKRHYIPTLMIVFGLLMLLVFGHLFASQQVGINPIEFVLKAFAKIFYMGVAWLLTHIFIKWFFPTIYDYCTKPGDAENSAFAIAFKSYVTDKVYDPRIGVSVNTHIGIFLAICLLLALAF